MVRAELGVEDADKLVPLANGGVALHKIFGLMHDTCSTANRVAELMAVLRDEQARRFHGEEMWDSADPSLKVVHNFLCGNHTRNLLVDRFNGFHDNYLEEELGEAIRAARAATGGRVRLECSGVCFLRSICRLTHRGHAQYVKGDGDAFADFLEKNYPGQTNACLSRADYSNRQDWSLEAAYEIFPLLEPLLDYEVKSLLDDPNAKHIADIAAPQDDPVFIELQGLYVGNILYDFETRCSSKLFRIVSIQFVRSYTSGRCSCWEATCEPVVRDPATGNFTVPKDVQVPGSSVTLTHALQGYCLAEYENGLDAAPTYLPWVQQYIDHFRNVILPKYPSIFLASPANKPAHTSPKELPSTKVKIPVPN